MSTTDSTAPIVANESVAPAPAAPAAAAAPTAPAAPSAAPTVAQELDLAFCCDCTGSMGAYIKSAQDNIRLIAQSISDRKGQECNIKYALVKYRDHPPQDRTFITEVFPFTASLEVMKANIDTMSASGGGDGPEAVTAALQEVLELNWRPNSTKVCVFIADAPPHGLGESGDGFPNGDPDGRDPLQIVRALATKSIVVYSIGVEPVLSTQYKFARDFMMMVAKTTEGKFLPLGKADILADVIVSTSIEGMELNALWSGIEEEIARDAAKKNENLSAEELCRRVEKVMSERAADVKVQQVDVSNPYMDARYDEANCDLFGGATTLAEARGKLRPELNAHVATETRAYSWGAQEARCMTEAPMAMSQMTRCAGKARKAKGLWS